MSSNQNLRIALMNIEANVNRAKSGDPDALDRIAELAEEAKQEIAISEEQLCIKIDLRKLAKFYTEEVAQLDRPSFCTRVKRFFS